MSFVKFTELSSLHTHVNVDHIVTVEEDGEFTRIDLGAENDDDKHLHAKEKVEQVAVAIEASILSPHQNQPGSISR